MNNRYTRPAAGFTLGGFLGWVAVQYGLHNSDWEENAPAYVITIFAFAMIGAIIGGQCNSRIDPNSPEEITKRNTKTLKQLEKVFNQQSVPLLTLQEFSDYKICIQNKPTQIIAEINAKIANYQAAIDAICPFTQDLPVIGIPTPITITKIGGVATATTYDYTVLKEVIKLNMSSTIMDHATELEINSTNFLFKRNYVPEIMDFIKEVRGMLQQRANESMIYRQNSRFLSFSNRPPQESKYKQLLLTNDGLVEQNPISDLRM